VKEKAANRFWGRRGGGYAGNQDVPYNGIPVACSCPILWIVAPCDLGRRCWRSGDRLVPIAGAPTSTPAPTNFPEHLQESA
jgi:hypothetical protein